MQWRSSGVNMKFIERLLGSIQAIIILTLLMLTFFIYLICLIFITLANYIYKRLGKEVEDFFK